MNKSVIWVFVLAIGCGPLVAQADAVAQLESDYLTAGAKAFSAAGGEAFWNKKFTDPKGGMTRSCGTCHGENLTQAGKHTRTKKLIKPMAPSANSARLTKVKKIEKWFKRNCKWTVGRECTVQEKGDMLAFLKGK
ncbi:MAG: DUF1924 domain-containing protein [Candidatus Sedimenticola sp. (ex Thyasira tokunagai)]